MEHNIKVKIKKVSPSAVLPEYATDGAAALDLRYCGEEPITVGVGEIRSIPTGLAFQTPNGVVAVVCARSGLAFKRGICLANGIGVIDSDYRGEVCVGLKNSGSEPFTVAPGDRIAQLMFMPVFTAELIESESLDETERGAGGFGSTGIK